MLVANDKIRVHMWIPVNDPEYKARYYNSLGKKQPEMEKNVTKVFFKRSTDFRA